MNCQKDTCLLMRDETKSQNVIGSTSAGNVLAGDSHLLLPEDACKWPWKGRVLTRITNTLKCWANLHTQNPGVMWISCIYVTTHTRVLSCIFPYIKLDLKMWNLQVRLLYENHPHKKLSSLDPYLQHGQAKLCKYEASICYCIMKKWLLRFSHNWTVWGGGKIEAVNLPALFVGHWEQLRQAKILQSLSNR